MFIKMSGIGKRLRGELLLAGRFAIVGIGATLVHMFLAWTLIQAASLPALLGNLAAFLTAFAVSFTGHYFWTFRAPGSAARAMRRLFIISGLAFLVNTILLARLLEIDSLSPPTAAVVAAGVVPAITFLASRLWGFSPARFAPVGVERTGGCDSSDAKSLQ